MYPRCAYTCKLALRGEGVVVSELFHTQELRRAQADCHDTSVLSAKRPNVIFDICLGGSLNNTLHFNKHRGFAVTASNAYSNSPRHKHLNIA